MHGLRAVLNGQVDVSAGRHSYVTAPHHQLAVANAYLVIRHDSRCEFISRSHYKVTAAEQMLVQRSVVRGCDMVRTRVTCDKM
jgi:hypothetical protein